MKPMVIIILLIFCITISGCLGSTVVDRRVSTSSQNTQNAPPIIDDTSSNKQSALSDYEAKISIASIEQNSLKSYGGTAGSYVSVDEYKSWIDGYKQRLDSYTSKCYEEIAAGQKYKTYLEVGSSEYSRVISNEDALNNNINTYTNTYNQLLADYNKKRSIANAASIYNGKIAAVNSAQKDLNNYINSAGSLSSLTPDWINGYGQKVDTYTAACDQAVSEGRNLQQFYAFGSNEYNQLSQTETILLKNENDVRTSYNELKSGNEDLLSLISIIKFIALF